MPQKASTARPKTTGKVKTNQRTPRAGSIVYEHVKSELLEDAYRDLTHIPIEAIATELNVSRQPVMDAIKRLSAEGFVEIIPQVGSRLRQYSPRDVIDFFEFFALIEAQLTSLAAIRANEESIVSLRLLSAQIGTLPKLKKKPKDLGKLYRNLNRKFHLEITSMADSKAVGDFVEILRDKADYFITWEKRFSLAQHIETSVAEHEEIIDAIEAGDANLAALKTKEHILSVDREWIIGE